MPGHDPRPQRTKSVTALAQIPLLVTLLQHSRRHVVGDRPTGDVGADDIHIARVVRDVLALALYDGCQLALVIDVLAFAQLHRRPRPTQRRRRLGKNNRQLRYRGFTYSRHLRVHLTDVLDVILPHAAHLCVVVRAREQRHVSERPSIVRVQRHLVRIEGVEHRQ